MKYLKKNKKKHLLNKFSNQKNNLKKINFFFSIVNEYSF